MNPDMFRDVYGHSPTVRVFCPGYLNLIGEHIVEHGYGTISIATDTGTEILAAVNNRSDIRITNTDEEYGERRRKRAAVAPIFSGWIPSSVGLSSSSSIVCAAVLATWAIYTGKGFEGMSREDLADLCVRGEHYVDKSGEKIVHLTQILGRDDMGVRFDYFPLSYHLVNIPPIAVFDVLHSGEKPQKAFSSRELRVAEGKIAGKLLLKNAGKACLYFRLRDVQEALGKRLEEMIALTEHLPETASRDELEQLLGIEQLNECLSEETSHVTSFKIRSTARYIFSEALRVNRFESACERRDLLAMGMIFNDCHESFNKDFECSGKAVDKLVTRCRMSHSYGAHVSGWSGMVVALIDDVRPVYLGDKLVYHAFASSGASIEFL
ncbi:GHMP kinase protein [Ancylostoma caninum]|uniref:GHMP kinase protein n=1 Tax=Ancylostoma caninum TaxID=29170 RepID=A0A368GBI0_ANCCA|nr:GHMP kinase protein [Ancylostoma caninum]